MSDILDKIDHICRICLLQQPLMHSLLDGTNYNQNISQLLAYFTTLEDEITCTLPQLLCNTCLERLGSAYTFKQDCKRADDILRKLIIEKEQEFNRKITEENVNVNATVNCDDKDLELEIKEEPIEENIEFLDDEKDENYQLEFKLNSDDDRGLLEQIESDSNLEQIDKSVESNSNVTIKTKTDSTETKSIRKWIRRNYYECLVCNKRFREYGKLLRHKKKKHMFVTCYVCWLPFSNKNLLEKHEEEHRVKLYLCEEDKCNKEFNNYRLFAHHKKTDHRIKNYLKCLECDETFNCEKKFDMHIQKHLYYRYRCKTCEEKFSSYEEVQKHTDAKHPKNINLECPKCSKIFTDIQALRRHKERHGTGKSFVCEECGLVFPLQYLLTKHIKVKHQNGRYIEKKDKLCPLCGKTFRRPSQLQIHLLAHEGIKPFACHLCDFKTSNKESLKKHIQTHSGKRPFTCEFCGKSYLSRNYLNIHKRWHTGERPFKCSFASCNKGFVTSSDLKIHERTHTGIKLYECDICFNSFTTLHYLKVHKKKHESESK